VPDDLKRPDAVDALLDAARRIRDAAERLEGGENVRNELSRAAADIAGILRRLYGGRAMASPGQGARHRILTYLLEHVGEDVSGEQLAAVSGIHAWARRVRELRVEQGYDIVERGGSTYRLLSPDPDTERAQRWQLTNEIRRRPGSALDRVEALLSAVAGQVVTRDEIEYVARTRDGAGCIRQLREDHGLPIDSRAEDTELGADEYRLRTPAL
jgi:biotin operon repressor